MNCPHCTRSLRYRERSGSRCFHCGQEFVFDPKTNWVGMHDLRLRRLVAKVSEHGKLRYTARQLWCLARRRPAPPPVTTNKSKNNVFGAVVGVGAVAVFALANSAGAVGAIIGVIATLLALWAVVVSRLRAAAASDDDRLSYRYFRDGLLKDWPRVYGELPHGLVDEMRFYLAPIAEPRMALLCADPSVVACLAANGVLHEHGIVAVDKVSALPPGLPVLVLHDASAKGLEFARQAPRSATVVGVHPRTARSGRMLVLRGPRPPKELMRELKDLSWQERRLLAGGRWAPIAAVPPKQLVKVVREHAATLAGAERIGFMTWPGA